MIFEPQKSQNLTLDRYLHNYSECSELTVWRDHVYPYDHVTSISAYETILHWVLEVVFKDIFHSF